MIITNAKLTILGKTQPGGLSIEFKTNDDATLESYFQLTFKGKDYEFKTTSVETIGMSKYVIVHAQEWAYKLSRSHNELDVRDIVGLEVKLITDPKRIEQIKNTVSYC